MLFSMVQERKEGSLVQLSLYFFWNLWLEKSAWVFTNKQQNIHIFIEYTSYLALSWSILSPPYCNYGLSTLLSQWRSFL